MKKHIEVATENWEEFDIETPPPLVPFGYGVMVFAAMLIGALVIAAIIGHFV